MTITIATINSKKYKVEHVFNMVSNWHFTDSKGVIHLVDGEDISEWAQGKKLKWDGVYTVIAYAKELAADNNGVFWWKVISRANQ